MFSFSGRVAVATQLLVYIGLAFCNSLHDAHSPKKLLLCNVQLKCLVLQSDSKFMQMKAMQFDGNLTSISSPVMVHTFTNSPQVHCYVVSL